MKMNIVTILEKERVTKNAIRLVCEKPEGFSFTPGQAVKLSFKQELNDNDSGAFTITSLPEDANLEFVIKIYPARQGFTDQLENLQPGDNLWMSEAYGYYHYRNSGMFIAAGSGITPFLSIFKSLEKQSQLAGNRLIYANDDTDSIISQDQLEEWFGKDYISILSQEKTDEDYFGKIDQEFLKNAIEDYTQDFYLCGPPAMMQGIANDLQQLGVKENQIQL